MATIADIRAQYPGAYDDLDDQQLADALYAKFYSDMDRREFDARSGLQPYQNVLEATGAALSNVPERMQMGVAGLQRAGADVANVEINEFVDRLGPEFALSQRPEIQEVNFLNWAKQRMGIAPSATLTPEQRMMIESMGRDPASIAEYQNAITRGATIGPSAMDAAEATVGAELRMRELQQAQAPVDVAPGSPEQYVSGAIGSVAEMAPALAASVAIRNPLPAMVWAGTQSGGIAYDEGRAAGLEPETARQYAALYAAAEGIPEALPVGIVINRLRVGGGLGRALGEGIVSEGIQEGVTEGLQALIDQQFIDPDMTWGDAWERIKDASITGAIAGGAMVGVARGTDAAVQGAGRAAQEAANVSAAVFGNVQQGTRDLFDATFDAAEATAARVRGLPLNDQIEAFARDQYLQPEGAAANTLQVADNAQPVSDDPRQGVVPTDAPTAILADLTYANEGATRSLPVTPNLETAMKQSVAQVYGPGYRIEVMSGGQDDTTGRPPGSSRRHDHGNAGDVWIIDPEGNRLEGDALLPIAQHWLSQGYGSVGFPSNGSNSLHLDLVHGEVAPRQGEGRFWFYGTATPEQRAALEGAASGAPARGLSTIDRIIMAESSGDPSARNPASSAAGLGQFIDSTWLATAKRYGGDRVRGLTDQQIIALKTDASPQGVAFQRQMLEAHTNENATALANAGIEANDANLYAAHFLGVDRARQVLGAADTALVSDLVPGNVIEANPFLSGMTVADFKAWAARKMDNGGAPARASGGGRPSGTTGSTTAQTPPAGTSAAQGEQAASAQTMRTAEPATPEMAASVAPASAPLETTPASQAQQVAQTQESQPQATPAQEARSIPAQLAPQQIAARLQDTQDVTSTRWEIAQEMRRDIEQNGPVMVRFPDPDSLMRSAMTADGRVQLNAPQGADRGSSYLVDDRGRRYPVQWLGQEGVQIERAPAQIEPGTARAQQIGSTTMLSSRAVPAAQSRANVASLENFSDVGGGMRWDGRTISDQSGERVGTMRLRVEEGRTPHVVIDDIEIRSKGQGTGSAIIRSVIEKAQAQGYAVALTSDAMRGRQQQARQRALYERLGFQRNTGANRIPGVRAEFVMPADSAQAEPQGTAAAEPTTLAQLDQALEQVQYKPGPNHVATFGVSGMPARPANNQVQVTGGNLTLPQKETKRDEPRKKLLAVVGDRIYFGRVQGKNRLGFYRTGNSEIRVKGYDDVEVLAHEAAHYLDFDKKFGGAFTAFRRGHASELDALSYTTDPKLVNIEGFAEFVRLWSTNYPMAQQLAPMATVNFETQLRRSKLLSKMKAFQQASHSWYWQGTMAQFMGKSGASERFIDKFNAFLRTRPGNRFIQNFVDSKYAAKVIEREATGTISSASNSAWKLYRMTTGGQSMAEAVIMDGTPRLMPDGSYGFRGKSLADVFAPVTKMKNGSERFDDLMAYFKARRARELMSQGRERLFTRAEINEGLALAKKYPVFEQVFADFQQFNSEMLDFYVETNLITPDQRAAFAANNTEYVPFHRVLDMVGVDGKGGNSSSDINRRLLGGEQNTREIADNIVDGLAANIQAALVARAKAKLFETIQNSQEGSEFAVKVPAGSKPLKIALEQYKSRFAEILVNLGYEVEIGGQVVTPQGGQVVNAGNPVNVDDVEALLNSHPELLQFWQHNQKPSATETHIEPVNINGETQWFEVQSPLLMGLLVAPQKAPALVKGLALPKQFLTTAITSMPQFMVPNLVRDTVSAGALTQSKFRPFVESGRGLRTYITNSDAFKLFRLNGGLFSGRIDEGQDLALVDRKKWQMGVPAANMFDQVGRTLARTTRIAAPFEQATRIGQFERATEMGIDPLEAAFQGREISTDFAQMGRNEVWRWFLQTVPFMNAGLQGIDQMFRHTMEADGKIRPNLKSATKFGVQAFTKAGLAITTGSIILWALNQDDERYQGLTPDEKARFWHLWLPGGQHVQIPKPYGVGFIFADIPEIALDFVKSRDGETAANQLAFGLMQHFWFLDYPGILTPMLEAMENRKFTGAPIIPQSLADVDPEYQYTDRTPEVYRALGKTFGISPLLAEHYVKGFGGYLEAFMVDATEFFLWDQEAWGDRPFARGPIDYFTHQFNGREIPLRTKWTEGYYDLRQRASGKAATYRHLFSMGMRDLADFTEFTENEVNLMLRELSSTFSQIDRAMSEGNGLLMAIKYNPELSREEKERQIDAWYAQRNTQLGTAYQQANEIVSRMERDLEQ